MCRVCLLCFGFERFADKLSDGNLNPSTTATDLRVGRDGFAFSLSPEAKLSGISAKSGRSLMDLRDFLFGVLEGSSSNTSRFSSTSSTSAASSLVSSDILGIGFNDLLVVFLFLAGQLFNASVFSTLGLGTFLMFSSPSFVPMEVLAFRLEPGECFSVTSTVRLWLLSFTLLLESISSSAGPCGSLGITDFSSSSNVFSLLSVSIINSVFSGDFGCCSGEVIRSTWTLPLVFMLTDLRDFLRFSEPLSSWLRDLLRDLERDGSSLLEDRFLDPSLTLAVDPLLNDFLEREGVLLEVCLLGDEELILRLLDFLARDLDSFSEISMMDKELFLDEIDLVWERVCLLVLVISIDVSALLSSIFLSCDFLPLISKIFIIRLIKDSWIWMFRILIKKIKQ